MDPVAPPAPDASAAPSEPEYDFGSALDQALEPFGGDAARAFRNEPLPEASPQTPPPPAPPAPAPPAAPKPGDAPPPVNNGDDDGTLLSSLLKGDEITQSALSKPGDAPTDPNSRAFKTWAELRSAYDLTAKEVETLKQQLTETQGKIPKDYEDIKRQNSEKDAHIAKIDLFRRPEYQQQIAEPIASYEREFDSIAARTGVSRALLREAALITDEGQREDAINRLFSEAPKTVLPTTMTMAVLHAKAYQDLLAQQQQYSENAPKMMQLLMDQDKAEAEKLSAKDKEEYSRSVNVAAQIIEKTLPFLKDKDGKVSKDVIDLIRKDADRDFSSLKPGQKAFALMSPTIVEQAVKAFKEHGEVVKGKDEEIARLKVQLSKYVSSSPSTTTHAPPAPGGGNQQPDTLDSYSGLQLSNLPIR